MIQINLQNIDSEDLYYVALEKYIDDFDDGYGQLIQPSYYCSELEGDFYVLRNNHEELFRYHIEDLEGTKG